MLMQFHWDRWNNGSSEGWGFNVFPIFPHDRIRIRGAQIHHFSACAFLIVTPIQVKGSNIIFGEVGAMGRFIEIPAVKAHAEGGEGGKKCAKIKEYAWGEVHWIVAFSPGH